MKHLIGKKMSTQVDFMGEKVTVSKLSVAQILKIQEATKKQKAGDEVGVLRLMVRLAVEGASELSDDEFDSFPLEELGKLGAEIVRFSGMNPDVGVVEGN
jgi:hypothetical protein